MARSYDTHRHVVYDSPISHGPAMQCHPTCKTEFAKRNWWQFGSYVWVSYASITLTVSACAAAPSMSLCVVLSAVLQILLMTLDAMLMLSACMKNVNKTYRHKMQSYHVIANFVDRLSLCMQYSYYYYYCLHFRAEVFSI